MTPARPLRSISRFVLAVALVATLVLAGSPADAHDELGSSTPAADAEVDTAPTEVSLRFGGTPLEIGATVIVADAAGDDWASAPPTVEGEVVRSPLRDGMPDGYYQVRWRIVSGDGAVVSGHFEFAVGDTTGKERVELPEPKVDVAAAPGGDDAGDFQLATSGPATATSGDSSGDRGRGRTVLVGALGAVAALAVAATYARLARPRHRPNTDPVPMEEP